MRKTVLLLFLFLFAFSAFSQNKWLLVMKKDGDYAQIWRTRAYFPENEIKEFWDKEYRITSLEYGEGKWILVMSKNHKNAQMWRLKAYFPKDEIQEYWDKGYHVSSLSYGDGKWALVMDKDKTYQQSWFTRQNFPEKEIKEYWDKGYRISNLTYGNGVWAAVMSNENLTGQVWRTRTYFPSDEIKEFWDKGYQIKSLCYGDGKWALVMSKTGGSGDRWKTRTYFPKDEIKTSWDEGYNIDFIVYGLEEEKTVVNIAPEIVITEPNISRGYQVVEAETVKVAGKATDSDGIHEVTINGRYANLQSDGSFWFNVPLKDGTNAIKIIAKDKKMKSATKTIYVDHNPKEEVVNNYSTDEKRVALIFGNSHYKGAADLGVNPINDANDIAATLKGLGFDVIIKTDANLNTMTNAVREFGRINADADIAVFFFAGHGMQVERVNYLLPIGINIKTKQDVDFECISVNDVQKIMETSNSNRLNIIILDACRNNPFRSWERGGEAGLSGMSPPSGTIIAFSTSPGSTASNGAGRNGLYTGELIKQLNKAQRIEDVFINTRIHVEDKSGMQQSPWELARLRGIYYLKR